MRALVFPGQGAQFEGMGKDLYELNTRTKNIFDKADEVLGYKLSDLMFYGSAEDLKATKVTQPALFVHSLAKLESSENIINIDGVAGHSLGEFSALVAAKVLSFEDGLRLVYERAMAMQDACNDAPGSMAAILGLEDEEVVNICASITDGKVVAANYNCPGQLVISGDLRAVEAANVLLKEAGAKRALLLPVGGAFHSPLMASAKERLATAILKTPFAEPIYPIYQNVVARAVKDPEQIKQNLIEQLTGSVKWTQTIQQMAEDGFTEFIEVGGSGKVLSGLISKINREVSTVTL
ncbi:MAG TPA: ACP S-malonyltransferase [Saprospiraceae bacterium]|nr:ACP S-malonyltransferase [Saprospiraceae bacterium]